MGDLDSVPGLVRSPGEVKGYTLQYSGLENSMDCIVQRVTKSQTQLSTFHFISLSCLMHLAGQFQDLYTWLSESSAAITHSGRQRMRKHPYAGFSSPVVCFSESLTQVPLVEYQNKPPAHNLFLRLSFLERLLLRLYHFANSACKKI